MERARIQQLNDRDPDQSGQYVLYWMQQAQRAESNHALEYAARLANQRGQGLIVGFGLMDGYPEANERHYAFMLEGLSEVRDALHERQIKFVVKRGTPDDIALVLAEAASLVVCDRGYLKFQRDWRSRLAENAGRCVIQVEGDAVVPIEQVSGKAEYAARTIRPKLLKAMPKYVGAIPKVRMKTSSLSLHVSGDVDVSRPEQLLGEIKLDRSVGRVRRFHGGTSEARRLLTRFIRYQLKGYHDARNDPADPQCSTLSPYLHFGQISPIEVVRKVRAASNASSDDCNAYLEELIVRRELALNFVHFEPHYDDFKCLPEWAKQTLAEHRDDKRPVHFTRSQLERAKTDDAYWNAAMQEMRRTGYMHNYMRMYWGKKILEWSSSPEYAYSTALYLNNKYFLDGRDPNSYANVAWIFGLHDRPWQERTIYGKVRTMTAAGLKRKFDIDAYVRWVEGLDTAEVD